MTHAPTSPNDWGVIWRTFLLVHLGCSVVMGGEFFAYASYFVFLAVAGVHGGVRLLFRRRPYTLVAAFGVGLVGIWLLLAGLGVAIWLAQPAQQVSLGVFEIASSGQPLSVPPPGMGHTLGLLLQVCCLGWAVSISHYIFYYRVRAYASNCS